MASSSLWQRFQRYFLRYRELGFSLDISRMKFPDDKIAEEIARSVDADPEDVFHLLRHLASNDARIKVAAGDGAADDRFSLGQSE